MWLIANWKTIAAVALCWMLHTLDVHRIEEKQANEITRTRNAMTDACNKVQETTRKISHDYQIQLGSLNSRLSAAKRLHNSGCVSVASSSAAGLDAAAAKGKLIRRNVDADRLIDLAGRGEKYRIQLISCQQFIDLDKGAELDE